MAGRVYSTNFIDVGPGDPSGWHTYEVGDGQTMVIREMTYNSASWNHTGGAVAFQVLIGPHHSVIWQMSSQNVEPVRTYMWEGREVLVGPGELLVTTEWDLESFRVNGYLLTP